MPTESRAQVRDRFQVKPYPRVANHKVGISRSVKEGILPIVGLQLPPVGDTTGWYIWAGPYSEDPDFYAPMCAEHPPECCPTVGPYLELPPAGALFSRRAMKTSGTTRICSGNEDRQVIVK